MSKLITKKSSVVVVRSAGSVASVPRIQTITLKPGQYRRTPRHIQSEFPSANACSTRSACNTLSYLYFAPATRKVPAPVRGAIVQASSFDEIPVNPASPDQDDSGGFSSGYHAGSSYLGETVRRALTRAASALRRYGWFGFWLQLTFSVVGIYLLFSVAFTSRSGPRASLYLTLFGILAGFLSTFRYFTFTRTAARIQESLDQAAAATYSGYGSAPPPLEPPRVSEQVMVQLSSGVVLNFVGHGLALIAIQALVGKVVANALSIANPYIVSPTGVYKPMLTIDVFHLRVATNALTGHVLSQLLVLRLMKVIGSRGGGLKQNPQQQQAYARKVPAPVRGAVVQASSFDEVPVGSGYHGGSSYLEETVWRAPTSAASALRRYGWFGFWLQLTVSVVSGINLLFAVAFTSRSGPRASLYLTIFGILAGFLSAFWNFTFTRTAARIQESLDQAATATYSGYGSAPPPLEPPRVSEQVLAQLSRGAVLNLVGQVLATIALQALVGQLFANPSITSATGAYKPTLTMDVFLLRAATNALTGHYLSLFLVLQLMNVIGVDAGGLNQNLQ